MRKPKENAPSIGTTHGFNSVKGRSTVVDYLTSHYKFKSIIDIGCGKGDLFYYLKEQGLKYDFHGVDLIPKDQIDSKLFTYYESDFNHFNPTHKFDLAFSSHTIEHNTNTGDFLKAFFSLINEGSIFCLIWPPPSNRIVGGHVHTFNMGLMVYNLVRQGIDCRNIEMLRCGYNLAIIGHYHRFETGNLSYNRHEIKQLEQFFPFPVQHGFKGDYPIGIKILTPNPIQRMKQQLLKFIQ